MRVPIPLSIAVVAFGASLTALAGTAGAQFGAQHAQNVPSVYAITGARIVPVTGPLIEHGTVVVRNGLIAAVGASVALRPTHESSMERGSLSTPDSSMPALTSG